MQQPLNDLQRWGDIWKWKRELLPFCGKENYSAFGQWVPNVWKINSFQPVAQFPLKTSVLQDLIRNGDLSARGNGKQSVGWSRPWPAQGGCAARLNAWAPTKWLQSAAPHRDMGCVLPKAVYSPVKVPAQQWAGSSDYTALGFFSGGISRVSICLGQWISTI